MQKQSFAATLNKWYKQNKRLLPWRETNDPYKIWLSEVILQQTRVAQGMPYYLIFLETYPTVQDLARAPQEQVLKLWEGLGYYSRARNMHYAAKQIVDEHNGTFPNTYTQILKLKGVGTYTAAAISSFAFNLPYAVLDGNVYRVLSRLFNIDTAINTPKAQKEFGELAQELLPKTYPAEHNQAIMEFGALQCVPKNPNCAVCPLRNMCLALQNKTVPQLPVKKKATKKRNRYFYYLQLKAKSQTAVQQRGANDIWQGLFQFPLIEFDTPTEIFEVLKQAERLHWLVSDFKITHSKTLNPHLLSHQKLWTTVITVEINSEINTKQTDLLWVNKIRLNELPMPVLLRNYLNENQLHLPL